MKNTDTHDTDCTIEIGQYNETEVRPDTRGPYNKRDLKDFETNVYEAKITSDICAYYPGSTTLNPKERLVKHIHNPKSAIGAYLLEHNLDESHVTYTLVKVCKNRAEAHNLERELIITRMEEATNEAICLNKSIPKYTPITAVCDVWYRM